MANFVTPAEVFLKLMSGLYSFARSSSRTLVSDEIVQL